MDRNLIYTLTLCYCYVYITFPAIITYPSYVISIAFTKYFTETVENRNNKD